MCQPSDVVLAQSAGGWFSLPVQTQISVKLKCAPNIVAVYELSLEKAGVEEISNLLLKQSSGLGSGGSAQLSVDLHDEGLQRCIYKFF